jgi:hypothetical protein
VTGVARAAAAALGAAIRAGRRLVVELLAVVAIATPVLADHPGPFRSGGSPILEALMWAGAAFLVGIAIVAVVAVLARKRTSSE